MWINVREPVLISWFVCLPCFCSYADRSVRIFPLAASVRYPRPDVPIVVHEHLHDSAIACALVSDDGQLIVLGGEDSVISLWRRHPVHKYRQLLPVGTLCAHTDRVTCLAASTSFRILVSGTLACIIPLRRLLLIRVVIGHARAQAGRTGKSWSGTPTAASWCGACQTCTRDPWLPWPLTTSMATW